MPQFAIPLLGCLLIAGCMLLATGQHFRMPPDSRPSGCKKRNFTGDFSDLKVSIIIPWHKEKWEHLRDTMEALLHFTPDELVEEYLFISDGNVNHRSKELKEMSPKVKVKGFKQRQGLIRAKTWAVKKSKAPVLMFLEAHCIVNQEWLPPLLKRLELDPKALVMPTLDVIPQTAWGQYIPGMATMWRYEWNMNLISTNPGGFIKSDHAEPFESPGTSGGIFVMRREWFDELEFFDTGMLEWGGDHAELSFKTWRCGGRIEVDPCSRIGHLFRDPEHRPYPVEVNQVVKNYDRLAQLWWKDHYKLFRRMKPESKGMQHKGLDKVRESYARLSEKLKCKDHQWYIENVDHEMFWEKDYLCHPHIQNMKHQDFCGGKLAPGKFTVTKDNEMPYKKWLKANKAAMARNRDRGDLVQGASGEL